MEKNQIKNNILVSIITVSFNSAKTIERTIQSVINQTYTNIEYIIIDGGSTDGTIDIIKKYSDKISYWVSEKDNGISDAFNKGIRVSNGEIIGIINSDDWYENDTIENVVKMHVENRADLYIGTLKYWLNNNKNIIIKPNRKYKRIISFFMPHLPHPASFVTKEAYKSIGLFNVKYKYAMDYDFFLRAYLKRKVICFTDKILANMFTGGASFVNKKEAYKEVFSASKNKILGFIFYMLVLTKIKTELLLNKFSIKFK